LAPSAKANWGTNAGIVPARLMTGREESPTLRRLRREVVIMRRSGKKRQKDEGRRMNEEESC
jgi:hypothetical protein